MLYYTIQTPKGKLATNMLYTSKKTAQKDLGYYTRFNKMKCVITRVEVRNMK